MKILGYIFPRDMLCINFYNSELGYTLGDFSQTHLVTLFMTNKTYFDIGWYIARVTPSRTRTLNREFARPYLQLRKHF
jgi:hypothetical protein